MGEADLLGVIASCRSILQVVSVIQNVANESFTIGPEYESMVDSLRIKTDFYEDRRRHGVPVDHIGVQTLREEMLRAEATLRSEEFRSWQLDERINGGQCCALGWWFYAKLTAPMRKSKVEKILKKVTDDIVKFDPNLERVVAKHLEDSPDLKECEERKEASLKSGVEFVLSRILQVVLELHVEVTVKGWFPVTAESGWMVDSLRRKIDYYGQEIAAAILESELQPEQSDLPACEDLESELQPDQSDLPACRDFQQYLLMKDLRPANRSTVRTLEGAEAALESERSDLRKLDERIQGGQCCAMGWWLYANFTMTRRKRKIEKIMEEVTDAIDMTRTIYLERKAEEADLANRMRKWNERKQSSFNIEGEPTLKANSNGGRFILTRIVEVALIIQELQKSLFSVPAESERRVGSLCRKINFYRDVMVRQGVSLEGSLVDRSNQVLVSLEAEQRKLQWVDEHTVGGILEGICGASSLDHSDGNQTSFNPISSKGHRLYAKSRLKMLQTKLEMILTAMEETTMPDPEAERVERSLVAITADAKVLLFLIYACKAGSVPGEVLRILYSAMKPLHVFLVSIEELMSRKLIEPSPARKLIEPSPITNWKHHFLEQIGKDMEEPFFSFPCSEEWGFMMNLQASLQDSKAWSLPGSVNKCMVGKEEIKHVLGALLGGDEKSNAKHNCDSEIEDAHNEKKDKEQAKEKEKNTEEATLVTTVLCALYFDQDHTDEAVADVATRARNAVYFQDSGDVNDQRRRSIEPLIWLLDHPMDGIKWKESNVSCVRKVFLKYICEGQVDYANIFVLLKLTGYPSAPLATLAAIANILSTEERPLLDSDVQNVLKALMDLLRSNEINMREYCLRDLGQILTKATNDQAIANVADMPNILAFLVSSIQDSLASPRQGSQELAVDATKTLWRLVSKGEANKDRLVKIEGALASLVRYVSKDDYPTLQGYAAGVFMSLATGGEAIKLQILDEDGALAAIVRSLSKCDNPSLEINATRTLENLSFGGEAVVHKMLKVGNKGGAMASLVRSLYKHYNHDLQNIGAFALFNLATGGESIKSKILTENRALAGLILSLSSHNNPTLAKTAAHALWSLACGGEAIKSIMVNEDRVLASLVIALSKDKNPALAYTAAQALWSLGCGGESIKSKMVKEDGVLASLVVALSKDKNSTLQEYAAGALMSLAIGGETIKLKILNEFGALAAIVRSLSSPSNPKLVENAAGALKYLACGGKLVKCIIAKEDSAFQSLLICFLQHDTPVQEHAIGALNNLAHGNEKMIDRILNEGQALPGLVRALCCNRKPILQRHAALALGNLATHSAGARRILENECEALVSLVKSLLEDGNPGLQIDAAGALYILAAQVMEAKTTIANVNGAITGLVRSMFEHDNPEFQRNAIGTLQILAEGGEETKLRIWKEYKALESVLSSTDNSSDLQQKAKKTLIKVLPQSRSEVGDDEIVKESSVKHGSETNMVEGEKIRDQIAHSTILHQANTHSVVARAITRGQAKHKAVHLRDRINDRRRKQIEPLLLLLEEPNKDDFQFRPVAWSVRQVFLKYVSEGQLDDDIFLLLRDAPLRTLGTICNIFSTEEAPLLNSSSQKLLEEVMHLIKPNEGFEKGFQRSVQKLASRALLHISRKYVKEESASVVTNTPGILDMLLTSIQEYSVQFDSVASDHSHTIASNAAKTLFELGYSLRWQKAYSMSQNKCGPS